MAGPEELKRLVGEAAAKEVRDGMVVGLGTGSTVRFSIEDLGRRVAQGLRIHGIPTSRASEDLARKVGIPLTTLEAHAEVDLTIDGADELDSELRLIKGGGGALTREKIVAAASRRMVVVADASKEVRQLGAAFPLPVEVVDFARAPVARMLEALGARVTVRAGSGGKPYVTDNGNPVLDAKFPGIPDPEDLEAELETTPGIVSCGLFIGLCDAAYVARPTGVTLLKAPS